MLISLHHLDGCKIITRSYKALMDERDLDFWGQNFQFYVVEFNNSLGDFTEENLTQLFQKVFRGKCESSWDPLHQTFNHLWTCRSIILLFIIFKKILMKDLLVLIKQLKYIHDDKILETFTV